ncbi:MAG: YHS domain-containing protein [Nitrososphaeria archaeon]|nr:YHS domain-containing protein [Nitrososphaeria archaeon]
MVVDVVCKMDVDPKKTKHKTEYKGTTYYFCSESCQKSFQQNPSKYLAKK